MVKTDLENDFAWTMYNRYRKHCDREQVEGGFQHFVKYLVSCGVIRERGEPLGGIKKPLSGRGYSSSSS